MLVRELIEMLGADRQDARVCICTYTQLNDGETDNLRHYDVLKIDVGPMEKDETLSVGVWFHDPDDVA